MSKAKTHHENIRSKHYQSSISGLRNHYCDYDRHGGIAHHNLTVQVQATAQDEAGQLLSALNEMNDVLIRIVSEVRFGAETIATASSQIAAGNLDLSSRTEQQASSLEETASSMEELSSTVKQNADSTRQAN